MTARNRYSGRVQGTTGEIGWIEVRRRRGTATALAGHSQVHAAGVSDALSGISGFFDGQLARPDLGAGYVAVQVGYVVVAWIAVDAAVYRLLAVRQMRVGPRSG